MLEEIRPKGHVLDCGNRGYTVILRIILDLQHLLRSHLSFKRIVVTRARVTG